MSKKCQLIIGLPIDFLKDSDRLKYFENFEISFEVLQLANFLNRKQTVILALELANLLQIINFLETRKLLFTYKAEKF